MSEEWFVSLLEEAICVLREEKYAAGESLLANLVEPLAERLKISYEGMEEDISLKRSPYKHYMPFAKEKSSSEELLKEKDTRFVLGFLPVYVAMQHFRVEKGDGMPKEFSRHAIAHKPTKQQFSKTNAAQGALCVTSLMAYHFQWDLR